MAETNSQSKRWCFTVNNPGEWRPAWQPGKMVNLVWQVETGENGTQHIQGYTRLAKRARMSTVKNILNNQGAHLEIARGTEKECKDYCTKEETRTGPGECHGEWDDDAGKQGKRSDLLAVYEKLKAKVPYTQVLEEHPATVMRNMRAVKEVIQDLKPKPPPQRPVETWVLWGPTNTGKTFRAWQRWPELYSLPLDKKNCWDLYQDEEVILLDEFNPCNWTIQEMNMICGEFRYQLNCRYQNKYARWSVVVICSNFDPKTWFLREDPTVQETLARRLTHVDQVLAQNQQLEGWPDPSPAAAFPLDPASPDLMDI